MSKISIASLCLLFAFGAGASEFGSLAKSRDLAERVIAIYRDRGLAEAVAFVHDPASGLGDEALGVNLVHEGRLVADNREPETVGFDYTAVIDLAGDPLWPRIIEALARGEDEFVTRWMHYDTGAPHAYRCVVRAADENRVVALVCR